MPMFHLSPFPPVSAVPIPHSGHMGEWYSSCKDSNRVAEQIFIDQLLQRRVFFSEIHILGHDMLSLPRSMPDLLLFYLNFIILFSLKIIEH